MSISPKSTLRFRTERGRAGWTLVELLIVTTLLPVVAMTAFGSFSAGAKLWKSLGQEVPEEDVVILHRKISADLETAIRYKSIGCEGDRVSFSFPGRVDAEEKLGGGLALGKVTWSYDAEGQAIFRRQRNIHDLHEEADGLNQRQAGRVSAFSMEYLLLDKEKKTYRWAEEWSVEDGSLPIAVRVALAIERAGRTREYEFSFPVPAGG